MQTWRELAWTLVGAAVGAVAGAIPAAAITSLAFTQIGFMDSEQAAIDEDLYLFGVASVAAAIVIATSAWSCRFVLRKRAIDRARETAYLLATLLTAIYLAAAYSSTTSYQSDLFPWAATLALLSPLIARAAVFARRGRVAQGSQR